MRTLVEMHWMFSWDVFDGQMAIGVFTIRICRRVAYAAECMRTNATAAREKLLGLTMSYLFNLPRMYRGQEHSQSRRIDKNIISTGFPCIQASGTPSRLVSASAGRILGGFSIIFMTALRNLSKVVY